VKHPSLAFYFGMSRRELETYARPYVFSAPALWNLPLPTYHDASPGVGRFPGGGTYFGMYDHGRLYVAVDRATQPQEKRGRVWSYPGHKTDRTVAGIMAHEMGHHVWAVHCKREDKLAWMGVVKSGPPITSYEPTYEEAFAETCRLFIMNPDLLAAARPLRYAFVCQRLALRHVTELLWPVVLAGAPDHIVESAERFAS
jgi:hypothetical protein